MSLNNWLVVWLPFIFPYMKGIIIIPIDGPYFSEGWPNHQPDNVIDFIGDIVVLDDFIIFYQCKHVISGDVIRSNRRTDGF